jgi:hypothetical protein
LTGVNRWIGRLLEAGAVLFAVGWILVFASGHGGNSTGGSELVWQVGGIMVYLGIPTLLIGGVLALAARMRSATRRALGRG